MNGQTMVKALVRLPLGATAVYNSSGLAYIRHTDHLGSSRLATTAARAMYASAAYAPYGEAYAVQGTTDLSFTGQDQDTTSGMYDFMVRKYNPVQGRWLSPDPAGLGAVDPANPQTWNRYAYVGNNPLSLIDPLGADAYEGCKENPMCYYADPWALRYAMSGWGDPFQVASIPVLPEDFHGTVEVKNGHIFISTLTSSPNPNFGPSDPVEFRFSQSWRDAGPVQFSGPIIWQQFSTQQFSAAANNGPCGGADCNAVRRNMQDTIVQQLKYELKVGIIKDGFCGGSVAGAIEEGRTGGAIKGGTMGAIEGFAGEGLVAGTTFAGWPGAIAGGAGGAIVGAFTGLFSGGATAAVCKFLGVYNW